MSRKIDKFWEQIFDQYEILEVLKSKNTMSITSAAINKFKEARLMTKFDHSSQLPEIFKNNDLAILPTSRGGYIIGRFEIFADFDKNISKINYLDFPGYIESIDYTNITSEATALNCAFASKILHDFTGEQELVPTVNGRMGSSEFSFNITSNADLLPIFVSNSQIEIDGGYEGSESLIIVEAKNYLSDDFIIRQLYYPYRLWDAKIAKPVRPVYMVYSNGIYHLREYKFSNINHYNSIELIRHKKYAIRTGQVFNIELIMQLISEVIIVAEPQIPFPQADSFERIINLCEIIKEGEIISKDNITTNYGFDSRQTDYYANAAKYLDLIEDDSYNKGYILTKRGKEIFELSINERQIAYTRLIISHKVFKVVLKESLNCAKIITRKKIVKVMKESSLYNVFSDNTYERRASTVSSWIGWILSQIEE